MKYKTNIYRIGIIWSLILFGLVGICFMNSASSMPLHNPKTIIFPSQTPLSADAFATAVDNNSMVFTQGSYPWTVNTSIYYQGTSCVKSANINHGQTSSFSTTVVGAGTIAFHWRTSSESYDILHFYVDEEEVTEVSSISGIYSSWESESYTITESGSHVLRWSYIKDGSISSGLDSGYVDYIRWTVGSSGSSPDYITITNPTSSSSYDNGDSMSIQWTSSGVGSNVKIELYDGSLIETSIISTTLNDGYYSYTIPSTLSYGSSYRIKITDLSDSSTYDYSDYFSIGSSGPDIETIIAIIAVVGIIGFVVFIAILKGSQNKAKLTKMAAGDRKVGVNTGKSSAPAAKAYSGASNATSSARSKISNYKVQVISDTFLKMK